MLLTWKDAMMTVLALGVGWFTWTFSTTSHVWFISSYRWAFVVLAVVGIAMCAFGARVKNINDPLVRVLSVLGILAIVFTIIGIVTGSKLLFFLLAGDILILWFLTTLRHGFAQ